MTKKYIRWTKKTLEKAITTRRVIIISGARQTGKTNLTEQTLTDNVTFRTLDTPTLLTSAIDDPIGFVNHTNKTMVIDEIQKAPILLSAIKKVVDTDDRNGQFVLTGSANLQTLPAAKESLAGRVKHIRLRPLTQGEILGNTPSFLQKAYAKNFPIQIKGCNKESILQLAFRGGYPEAIRQKTVLDRKDWHKDYLDVLLEHDLRDISNIRRTDVLKDLVKILASWSSKYLDISGICSGMEISKPTIMSYINALISLYIFDTVPAWIKTDYDRVGKKHKWIMNDTGLMTSILGWNLDDIIFDPDKSGKLIESFVYNELSAQIDLDNTHTLYHYRDRTDHEIDFIIENDQGQILGIEMKAGSHITKDDFKHLIWFKENMAKNKKMVGIVLYAGEDTVSFGEDFMAVPLSALWE